MPDEPPGRREAHDSRHLPPHLHAVYLTGGLPELLSRDFQRDWLGHWAGTGTRGASVVFNDPRNEVGEWRRTADDGDWLRFCSLGVVVERLPLERLLRSQDGPTTLFILVRPDDEQLAIAGSVSLLGQLVIWEGP